MMELTLETAIVAAVMGLIGGVCNEAYAYLKLDEPFVAMRVAARMVVGLVAGLLLVHAVLPELNWYAIIALGLTAGYFGVDVIDFLIKKPIPKVAEAPVQPPAQ